VDARPSVASESAIVEVQDEDREAGCPPLLEIRRDHRAVLLRIVRVGRRIVQVVERVHERDRQERHERARDRVHVSQVDHEREVHRQERTLATADAMQRRGEAGAHEGRDRAGPGRRCDGRRRDQRLGEVRRLPPGLRSVARDHPGEHYHPGFPGVNEIPEVRPMLTEAAVRSHKGARDCP
jgi:hypothetical protein